MSRRRPTRPLGCAAAVLVTALLAACTSAGQPPPSTLGATPTLHTPLPSASASAPAGPVSVWPLSGLPGSAKGAAVVVPVQLTSGGTHASGMDNADIVEMEYAEEGSFRLVGVFQSKPDSHVGPLGMIRPSDGKLFSQTAPVFVETGSPAGFVDSLQTAGLSHQTAKAGHDGIDSQHGQLYVDTTKVAATSSNSVPQPMFQYAAAGQPVATSSVAKATTLVVKVSGHSTVTWHYDASAKLWRTSIDGSAVSAENVLVLTVSYTTKYVSGLKRHLTFADPTGQGSARIVTAEQSVSAIWSKKNFNSALNLLCPDANVPTLAPGRTWIVVVPSGSSVTTA